MADADPTATLRRAAEVAPQVLPQWCATYIAQGLNYAASREIFDDDPLKESDEVMQLAREVLALAEQVTRPTPLVARTWLAKELHDAGACEPGGEEGGQVVCDENCRNLAKMAQDVFLGGPIDWTREEL